MSTIKVDTIKNGAGTREYFPCTAWVNFNGTGTVAIRDSGNVSSITDNGTGDYTLNFTVAMADADYSISAMGSVGSAGSGWGTLILRDTHAVPTTSACRVGHIGSTNWTDCTYGNISIHGGTA